MDVRSQLHDAAASHLVKNRSTHLNRRLCGPQTWSRHFWRRDKYLACARIRTSDMPVHSLVIILITPSQLLWVQRGSQNVKFGYVYIFHGNYWEEWREIIKTLQPDWNVIQKAIQWNQWMNNSNHSLLGDRSIPLIYLHANPLFMIHISIKYYYKDWILLTRKP